MQLTLSSESDKAVCVACDGEICQSQFPAGINNPLEELLGANCYGRNVVLDLGQATFIDSSGVAWIMGCHKQFKASAGKLILHSVPPMIDQVLRLLQLHNLLTVKTDRAAAMALTDDARGTK